MKKVKRTHEEFLAELKLRQPELFNSIKIIGKYKRADEHIIVENEFGLCSMFADSLLRGNKITIVAAIDKNSYALKEIKQIIPNFSENYTIISDYTTNKEPLKIQTKYGVCLSSYSSLKKGYLPSIYTAVNKTEYFKNKLKDINPKFFDKFEIVSEYINDSIAMTVKSELGVHNLLPQSLLSGNTPSIRSVNNKLDYFKAQLKQKYPKIYENIEIISDYTDTDSPLKVKVKYGVCITTGAALLQGLMPGMKGTIDRADYFKNHVMDVNPTILKDCEIISEYTTNKTPILISTKLGIVSVLPASLYKAKSFSIKGAINKTEYWINEAREIHGDLYDYSLVNYKNARTKVKIISKHGVFEQRPNDHLDGAGCQILGKEKSAKYQKDNPYCVYKDSDWIKKGLNSKYFDSFKIYIIRCFKDNEEFYKIGKTFTSLKLRFNNKKMMPYNYEIMKEIIDVDGKNICNLERNLHKEFVNFKYLPEISFAGKYECFSNIDNLTL